MADLSPRVQAAAGYGCRYTALVEVLAAIDGTDAGGLPSCDATAVFATTVVRDRRGGPCPIHTRTCAVHDAVFHLFAGYAGSVRLSVLSLVPAAREAFPA